MPAVLKWHRLGTFAGCVLLSACTGLIGDSLSAPNDVGADSSSNARDIPESELPQFLASTAAMKLLSVQQRNDSLHDIFGAELAIPETLNPPRFSDGFSSLALGSASLTASEVESFESEAEAIARQVMSTTSLRTRFLGCVPSSASDDCVRKALAKVGRRLFRAPVADSTVGALLSLSAASATDLGGIDQGIAAALSALLQSPRFLYRVENGETDPDDPSRKRFTAYEMATRLAFFIWNSGPDEALLAAAQNGELDTTSGIATAASRLLADGRSKTGLAPYFRELLVVDDVSLVTKDPDKFPEMTTSLAESMERELNAYIESFALEDESFLDMFVTPVAFADDELAAHYDLPSAGNRVNFPATSGRAGFLTTAGYLAIHAKRLHTSPTLRGLFVRNRLLCDSIPPPPADAGTFEDDPSVPDADADDMRALLSMHQQNPSCASCHKLMDPLGFGLEAFTATGARHADAAQRDLSGELDGVTFTDAPGMSRAVRSSPKLADCMVRRFYRHAVSHHEILGEERSIRAMSAAFADSQYRIASLVVAIVQSDAFRYTRTESSQ
ncbi:MAG: DUF1592 domain-containing protein [Clostridia bacterium]|nr:DUF1592 domain-containing protein [Deltaproteobacteria bacterium]